MKNEEYEILAQMIRQQCRQLENNQILRMQEELPSIRQTHNLFLHRVVDNQQAKSVSLMKLESHRTLYREGVEAKYLWNLVVAGRNFIEVFAVFQHQITLSMGNWHIYEDILGVQQWDKTIVIVTAMKIVGLIYEDCIFKNSFMLSLEFLELGHREPLDLVCDRAGHYLALATARELLFCVSQKAIQKYKAKPFYHRNSIIVEEDIKWNRPDFQSISDVIKFDFYDFELSKLECLHFCDQELYFVGHSSKNSTDKSLFQLPIAKLFSDDENQALILNLSQQPSTKREVYPIRRGNECEFLVIRDDNTLELENQRAIITLENELGKGVPPHLFKVHKTNNLSLFPLFILLDNTIHIYDRLPSTNPAALSTASHFSKRKVSLPQHSFLLHFDIRDNIIAYCNLHEVGILYPNAPQPLKETSALSKTVLKESFGRVIDFNINSSSKSILIVDNYADRRCRLHLLRRGIVEDPRPFITHAKKKSLESIPAVKAIQSLEQSLEGEIAHKDIDEEALNNQVSLMRSAVKNFYVIGRAKLEDSMEQGRLCLYRLEEGHKYVQILAQFDYYTIYFDKNGVIAKQGWFLLLWKASNSVLQYYQFRNIDGNASLELVQEVSAVTLYPSAHGSTIKVNKIHDYLISVHSPDLTISFYSLQHQRNFNIKLQAQNFTLDGSQQILVSLNNKSITFNKKDRNFFFLEAVVVYQGSNLLIYEISVDTQLSRVSHRSHDIGEGLPILLPSNSANLVHNQALFNHKLRSFMCPEYVLPKQNITEIPSPTILAMHTCEYEGLSYLFLINSNQELLVYKKLYCSGGSQHSLFGMSEVGFFYHRLPLPLAILNKFRFSPENTFVELGCAILRISNLAFYKGAVLEIPEDICSAFEMDGEVWGINVDGKIKMLITEGKAMSHNYLCHTVDSQVNEEVLGLESTNEYYVVYSRTGFQVFDKELMAHWSPHEGFQRKSKETILAMCAFGHYLAVSLFNYCESQQNPDEYLSIKFKLRLYNTITKNKVMEDDEPFEEPIQFIRFFAPDKLILVTPSNIFVSCIKNDRHIEIIKSKNYTKKNMLSTFSYVPEKLGAEVGLMTFGGLFGGLSLMVGRWIDQDNLKELWFDGLKCGIRESEIFRYGNDGIYKVLVVDTDGNIIIFNMEVDRLGKLADFHLGSQVNSVKKRNEQPYLAGDDGCIRRIVPIRLKDYEVSFLDLQDEICQEVPFIGGFNTRDSRCLQQRERTYKVTSTGNMVDGELLEDFMSLTETIRSHILQKADMSLKDFKEQLLNLLTL